MKKGLHSMWIHALNDRRARARSSATPEQTLTDSTHPGLRALSIVLASFTVLLLASCEGGNPLFPDTGSVEVTVSSNAAIPQGGYTVTLDGNRTRSVTQTNSPVLFEDVPSGQREIALSGLSGGCSAVDNPRVRNLEAGGIIRTTFVVAC